MYDKNFDLKKEGIIEKISYEHFNYGTLRKHLNDNCSYDLLFEQSDSQI